MRLHIHPFEGSGDGLCGSFQRAKEPITVTPAEIIYQRRIAVLDHAQRTGNVAEACRVFGISRTRYYEWKNVADRYGLEALVPKARRAPQMPEAAPTHVVEALLTLAVTQPTIGCRQYADRLGDQGFSIAKSTVQKHLVAHAPGLRSQRLARAAAIAAATTGLVVPDTERKDEPFGFCLATGGPGELVCLDSFYIGKLKGVGKVYQLTAIDVPCPLSWSSPSHLPAADVVLPLCDQSGTGTPRCTGPRAGRTPAGISVIASPAPPRVPTRRGRLCHLPPVLAPSTA